MIFTFCKFDVKVRAQMTRKFSLLSILHGPTSVEKDIVFVFIDCSDQS